jgi:putative membrane protein
MPSKIVQYLGFGVVALLLVAAATAASAEEPTSLKAIVSQIRQAQGLTADQSINCNKVTDSQYEAVGEAWMDVMVPDPQRHAMMDRMMGGPGSASLATAHRMMGARYLGCLSNNDYWDMMMPGMMSIAGGFGGGGMMGYGGRFGAQYGGDRMMGGYGGYGGWVHSWSGEIIMWIILLIVIGLIIYLIVSATRRRDGGSLQGTHSESPLDVLNKRYARGEISKEDFERMKKDIG